MAMLLRGEYVNGNSGVTGSWFGGYTDFLGICLARPDLEREKDVCFASHHSSVLLSLWNIKLRMSMSVRLSGINSGLLGTFVFFSLVKRKRYGLLLH